MSKVCQVTGKRPMAGDNRQPRDEQDPSPFSAEPPHPPFLGGGGEALCEIASVFERHADHRQEGHRRGAEGGARGGPQGLTIAAGRVCGSTRRYELEKFHAR